VHAPARLINDRLTFKQHDHPTIHPRFQPA